MKAPYSLAILIAVALTVLAVSWADAGAAARQVSLADAASPPSHMFYVSQHGNLTITDIDYTDVQAYRWDGGPLPAQRGDKILRWGRGVTFDTRTGRFTNGRRQPVLLALWR